MDLDIALMLDQENLNAFLDVITTLRLKPGIPVAPEYLLRPEEMAKAFATKGCMVYPFRDPDQPLRHIDVFLTPDKSYEKLRQDAVGKPLGSHIIWIASLAQMFELKKQINPPRSKDMMDIYFLREKGFAI
jgi:hypothetical protein